MNLRNVTVVVTLSLAIVFLLMDKCGSSRRADELKGEHKKAIEIARVERVIKEEIIKEQNEKIVVLNTTIEVKNTTIAKKERANAKLDNTVADLEEEFSGLTDKDEKIANLVSQVTIWKEKFTLSQGIISDKDAIIFSLTEKYDAQLIISISYKDMCESTRGILVIRDKQVKELEKINRRLKLTSGLKTGVVLTMAGVVLYSLLKD